MRIFILKKAEIVKGDYIAFRISEKNKKQKHGNDSYDGLFLRVRYLLPSLHFRNSEDSLCPVIVPSDRPVDLPLIHFACGSAYLIISKELLVFRLVNPFAHPVVRYQPLAEALFEFLT